MGPGAVPRLPERLWAAGLIAGCRQRPQVHYGLMVVRPGQRRGRCQPAQTALPFPDFPGKGCRRKIIHSVVDQNIYRWQMWVWT